MAIANAIKLSTTFALMEKVPHGKLKDRLTWARERLGLTQSELAKRSKIAQSTIASWETGARETGRKILALAESLEVEPLWLAEGKGAPLRSPGEAGSDGKPAANGLPKRLQSLVFFEHITAREAALLHKFQMASEDGKEKIETMADLAERDQLSLVHDQPISGKS